MNAIAAIIFIAFVGGALTMNFVKDKEYSEPPAIEQAQTPDTIEDGDTTSNP